MTICKELNCNRGAQTAGMCVSHYAKWNRLQQPNCEKEDCEKKVMSSGLCSMHYNRERILRMPPCAEKNCNNISYAKSYCEKHYKQKRKEGLYGKRRERADFYITPRGYRKININGASVWEHRFVMEQHLGRDLLPEENVHHINGDKLDNKIENLELWNTRQPSGQRVEDKVAWAIEILHMYKPELLKIIT